MTIHAPAVCKCQALNDLVYLLGHGSFSISANRTRAIGAGAAIQTNELPLFFHVSNNGKQPRKHNTAHTSRIQHLLKGKRKLN